MLQSNVGVVYTYYLHVAWQYFLSLQAADANAKDNYEQALKYHRKARFCNIGAGVAIVTSFIYYIGIIIAIISATN